MWELYSATAVAHPVQSFSQHISSSIVTCSPALDLMCSTDHHRSSLIEFTSKFLSFKLFLFNCKVSNLPNGNAILMNQPT